MGAPPGDGLDAESLSIDCAASVNERLPKVAAERESGVILLLDRAAPSRVAARVEMEVSELRQLPEVARQVSCDHGLAEGRRSARIRAIAGTVVPYSAP